MDFSRTRIAFDRPLTSYSKVQVLVGHVLRGRQVQLGRAALHDYLNVGCGANVAPGFLNLDYAWRPGVVCWDVRDGLPVTTGSAKGVFSEHCLEHFPIAQGFALLREFHRVLGPGGIARIIVPDARLYLMRYFSDAEAFPYQDGDSFQGLYTRMMSVNRIFYVQRDIVGGHQFMYDVETLIALLRRAGFSHAQPTTFRISADPKLCLDSESRRPESLYVEATK